jgi:hypothetical protein
MNPASSTMPGNEAAPGIAMAPPKNKGVCIMIAENTTEDVAETNIAASMLHNLEQEIEPGAGIRSAHFWKGAAIVGSVLLFIRGHKLSAILLGSWPLISHGWKSTARHPK